MKRDGGGDIVLLPSFCSSIRLNKTGSDPKLDDKQLIALIRQYGGGVEGYTPKQLFWREPFALPKVSRRDYVRMMGMVLTYSLYHMSLSAQQTGATSYRSRTHEN